MITFAPPPGADAVPFFDGGWVTGGEQPAPFLSYASESGANWSDDLEHFHAEMGRVHFLDEWTRTAIIASLGGVAGDGALADLGCSTGYLLEDLDGAFPAATLIGVDLVASGLVHAHALVPSARLIQADVRSLPLPDESLDAVVSANLLEHVPDDSAAIAEIRRVLRPGAPAVIVVPAGTETYDYYDRFLGHERRYARGELAEKARGVGLEVTSDRYLASLLFPAFWFVKKRNRRRYAGLAGEQLERKVAQDIADTSDSRLGRMSWRLEEKSRLRLPFGIRNIVVLQKSRR